MTPAVLVVGLSTRWEREGLGPARLRLATEAARPTLLVRRVCARAGSRRRQPDPLHLVDPRLTARGSRHAGRLVGPAGEELLPLLAGQRAVRDRAGALRSMTRGRCPRRLPRRWPRSSAGGARPGTDPSSLCGYPTVSLGPIWVPVATSQSDATGSKPETARARPSGLNSSANAPAPPTSSSRTSFPVRTSQRRTTLWSLPTASIRPSGLRATDADQLSQPHGGDRASAWPRPIPLRSPAHGSGNAIIVPSALKATSLDARREPMSPRPAPVATSQSFTPTGLAVASVVPSGLKLTQGRRPMLDDERAMTQRARRDIPDRRLAAEG